MKVTVCRKEHFNAAHRLYNPQWSDTKNDEIFGLCNNANFHGHNYNLTVKVKGEINEYTGYVIDMKKLKDIIKKKVISKFDHKNLNLDVEEFRNLNPTAENIAVIIWNLINEELEDGFELSIVLYETERNYVEYKGE